MLFLPVLHWSSGKSFQSVNCSLPLLPGGYTCTTGVWFLVSWKQRLTFDQRFNTLLSQLFLSCPYWFSSDDLFSEPVAAFDPFRLIVWRECHPQSLEPQLADLPQLKNVQMMEWTLNSPFPALHKKTLNVDLKDDHMGIASILQLKFNIRQSKTHRITKFDVFMNIHEPLSPHTIEGWTWG